MRRPTIAGFFRRLRRLRPPIDSYLRKATGVIHIGANDGRERHIYARYGLPVIWIEPIPEVFARLVEHLRDLPRQRAICDLVTDRDGAPYEFHVADNGGESSSVFEMADHRDIWPDVTFERTITLRSATLMTIVAREAIDLSVYSALVLDVQGAERLVLAGAGPLLERFRFIKLEAADFEAYRGGCQLGDLEPLLAAHGFRERRREMFARHPSGKGAYYDIVYERRG
jgi:FkbM family methyltransferase